MTTATTIFAKTIVREQRLPLDLRNDPFYSTVNQNRLNRAIENYETGKSDSIKMSMEELDGMAGDA